MTEPPQTVHLWPNDMVVPQMDALRRNIVLALQQRAELTAGKTWSLTHWPSPQISLEEYELYVRSGDRVRSPSKAARDEIETTGGDLGSKKRGKCYDAANTAHCTLYLAGLLASTMGLPGIHLTLDILDGVRTLLDPQGFVVEQGPIRSLTKAQALTPEQVRSLRELAVGPQPDGINGVGQSTCLAMLHSLANRAVSVDHLRKNGRLTDGNGQLSAEARELTRSWPVLGLEIDETIRAAAKALQREVEQRRAQAAQTRQRYQRAGRPAPACGIYV